MSTVSFAQFLRDIARHRAMIGALALRDLQAKYAGTLGGTLWTFTHPLAIVVIFYFVFAVGFKAQGPSSTPFILWFVCGLVPWFFFNDTLTAITGAVTSNAHLVKKTVFPTEILPLVHICSGLIAHAVFLVVAAGLLVFYHVPFLADRLLLVYFIFCNCALLLGLGWMLSALQVFYRDISQALTIFLNLWFWVTPIVWSADIMPSAYRSLLAYNPMYYVIEGYRGLLIFHTAVWPGWQESAYFWTVTVLTFFIGAYVFRRLKPEFADVM